MCHRGHLLPPVAYSSSKDLVGDVRDAATDLVGASAVFRPASRDLFVRLDLARMPTVAGVPVGGPLYGLRFAAGGRLYEVRAQRVPCADFDPKGGASFGLFRHDATTGLFTRVATLKGGYGTTGPSVVVAVPLRELGAANVGRLSDVRAFTGLGSYLTGVTKVLDAVRLAR